MDPANLPSDHMAMNSTKNARRVRELNKLAIDLSEGDEALQSFSKLLTLLTGTKFSQINIFDSHTQYTLASDGAQFPPLPKSDTFCTYTLDQESTLEIPDMRVDERVKGHFAVTGEPHVNYYYGTPLITHNQIAIGTVCVIHDQQIQLNPGQEESIQLIAKQITEYLENKQELIETKKQVEEQRSALNKVVHDLRGPMSGILGSISMVDLSKLKPELKKVLSVIRLSSENLIEYVNQHLDKALYKSDESDFITAATLQKKLRSLYQLQAEQKKLELDFSSKLDPKERITTLASGELINVIGNLLSNALKFSPQGETITLHMDYDDTDKKAYRFTISDQGVGMSDEQIRRIQELKQSPSQAGTDNEQGFGIGLSEALHTLQNFKGSFDINSKEGQGTRFIIRFPRKY